MKRSVTNISSHLIIITLGRKKRLRFSQNALSFNVLEPEKPFYKISRGNWNKTHFQDEKPLVLELACGRGEYTVGLAQVYPDKHFIGVDVKGDRLAVGSQQATELQLPNVAFLRTNITFIQDFFNEGEVSEIWLTFPDPFHLKNRVRRRLTHSFFLEKYRQIMSDSGWLHLKTDNQELFEFTLAELQAFGVRDLISTTDLYQSEMNQDHYGIKTRFEHIFTEKGFQIHYLRCRFLR